MVRVGVAVLLTLAAAAAAEAQFGRGFRGSRVATDEDFDGRFHYCRLLYRPGMNGYGGSWRTDYPNADINLSVRLSELTKIPVSKNGSGAPNHLLVRPGGDELFQCPLVIMSAPGSAIINEEEAQNVREYLLKGGVLWTDDSWGSYQWQHWVAELRKILPPSDTRSSTSRSTTRCSERSSRLRRFPRSRTSGSSSGPEVERRSKVPTARFQRSRPLRIRTGGSWC